MDLILFLCNMMTLHKVMDIYSNLVSVTVCSVTHIPKYGAFSSMHFVHEWRSFAVLLMMLQHFGQNKVSLLKSSLQYLDNVKVIKKKKHS